MDLDEPFALSSNFPNDLASPAPLGVAVILPDVTELGGLPAEGEITFRFKRGELRLRGGKLSAELILSAILKVEGEKEEGEDEKSDDIVDKLFAEADKTEDEGQD